MLEISNLVPKPPCVSLDPLRSTTLATNPSEPEGQATVAVSTDNYRICGLGFRLQKKKHQENIQLQHKNHLDCKCHCYHVPHGDNADSWVTKLSLADILTGLTFIHIFRGMFPHLDNSNSPASNPTLVHKNLKMIIVPVEGGYIDHKIKLLRQTLRGIRAHTCQCDYHKFHEIRGPYRKCPFKDLQHFTKHVQYV